MHVQELTQTTRSFNFWKSRTLQNAERLAWEAEFDCVAKMKTWLIDNNIATSEELEQIDKPS